MKIFGPRACPAGCVERIVICMQLFITILQLICAVAVVLIVMFQSGKSAGLSGAIGGVSESFVSKNKARSLDANLAKATKWVAIAFVVLTLILNIIG